MPWRNGAGLTRDVAADVPGDAWGWRVSLATLAADAPFSRFDGVDRSVMLVDGGPVHLAGDRWRRTLAVGDIVAFAGEDRVAGSGTGIALNVMTRRCGWRHRLTRVGPGPVTADLVVALTNGLAIGEQALDRFDAIAGSATLAGAGRALAIQFVRRGTDPTP